MACIEVTQEIEMEVAADQTVEIIASLIGGILLAIIIIAIILLIRCRRVIVKTVSVTILLKYSNDFAFLTCSCLITVVDADAVLLYFPAV